MWKYLLFQLFGESTFWRGLIHGHATRLYRGSLFSLLVVWSNKQLITNLVGFFLLNAKKQAHWLLNDFPLKLLWTTVRQRFSDLHLKL